MVPAINVNDQTMVEMAQLMATGHTTHIKAKC